MKNTILFFFAVLCSLGAQAQITITNVTFPSAGDTLRYAQANNQTLPNMLTPPGGNQTWDFSTLSTNETFETVYRPAGEGQNVSQFPEAELGVFTAAGERYYNVTSSKFELLGYTGTTLFGYDFNVLYIINPPYTERYAPLNFFDIYQQSNGLLKPFAFADLPPALQAILNPNGITIDSIRLRYASNILDVVDAWGTLTIPGPMPRPQYPVLRQKRTEYHERRLDAKVPPLGWLDVTDVAINNGLQGSLGVDTLVSHYFISNDAKEEIAVITLDNQQSMAVSVRYKHNEMTTPVADQPTPNDAAIQAYPNPAAGWVHFECSNLSADSYFLRLFDSAGRVVWSKHYLLAGNESIRVELKHLEKGLYLYRLEDRKGRLVGADRLVVGRD